MLNKNVLFRKPDEAVCWCGKKYNIKEFEERKTDKIHCQCGMINDKPKFKPKR